MGEFLDDRAIGRVEDVPRPVVRAGDLVAARLFGSLMNMRFAPAILKKSAGPRSGIERIIAGISCGRRRGALVKQWDAIVVGSGPNGLAAAITLARAGRSVLVLEATETAGGGCRTAELTLPGFRHDVCATSHPLTSSRFFRERDETRFPIGWIEPPVEVAHPLDDGSAGFIVRSVDDTAAALGEDGNAYRRLFGPIVEAGLPLLDELLAPLHLPGHPLAMLRFGLHALQPAKGLSSRTFSTDQARALFGGLAAHSMLSLNQPGSAAAGLVLGALAHLRGWPFAAGGSQRIIDSLVVELLSLGGEIRTGVEVTSLTDLPESKSILFDLAPSNLARIAGSDLPAGYQRALGRYRHGPGSFKIDYALDGPIPWRTEVCARAGVVHLGGTFDEVAESEEAVTRGRIPGRPFVLLAQPSLFDPSRSPAGKHTAWAYCHVPNGSNVDMTERIERQIERFAPGFRDRVLARATMGPGGLERYNANYIGGDIGGGLQDLRQLFTRPVARWYPYATPNPRLFLCSASTPPGAGVHGMCGYAAAKLVLGRLASRKSP